MNNSSEDTVLENLTPNQQTESSVIPAIVAERSEPGQKTAAKKADLTKMFGSDSQPDSQPESKSVAKPKGKAKDRTGLIFHANIGYITRKGVMKSAQLSQKAHSKQEAEGLMRQTIMSNGLRQAKSIMDISWLDKPAHKQKAAMKPMSKPKPKPKPKANLKLKVDRPAVVRSRTASRAYTRTERDQAPIIKIGIWNFIPAVFAAVAGATYGITRGLLNNK